MLQVIDKTDKFIRVRGSLAGRPAADFCRGSSPNPDGCPSCGDENSDDTLSIVNASGPAPVFSLCWCPCGCIYMTRYYKGKFSATVLADLSDEDGLGVPKGRSV